MGNLKSCFTFHKDCYLHTLPVCFSFRRSALVHTISATNTVQFSVSMCVIFCQPRCLSLGLFVCLNSPYWTPQCFTCLSASYCFSLCLPVFMAACKGKPQRWRAQWPVQHMWQSRDTHSYKTKYYCSTCYQTATNSNQTRHTLTPPNAASSLESAGNKQFSLGQSCKHMRSTEQSWVREAKDFCIYL